MRDENTSSGWSEDPKEQTEILDEFFDEFDDGISLVFYYVKDGHPLSEEHNRILVGVGRILEIADQVYFPDSPHPVWARRLTQNYPEEGVRLPYQEYLEEGYDTESILCPVPFDVKDEFSYVAEHVSDDSAIGMLERFLESVRAVKREGLVDGDWDAAVEWIEAILNEVWDNRGMYPGLEGMLNYLEADGSGYQRLVLSQLADSGLDQLEHVLDVLTENTSPQEPFEDYEFIYARQTWTELDSDQREVLKTLTGFDLTEAEIKRVMDSLGHGETPIPVSYEELQSNLYVLTERDQGDDEGATIGFETIDRGLRVDLQTLDGDPPGFLLPVRREDKRRVRALLKDVLEKAADQGDTLLSIEEAVRQAEQHLPEERKCSPTVGDIDADLDFYSEAFTVSEHGETTTIALPRLSRMESEIAETVTDLVEQTLSPDSVDWRTVLDRVLGPAEETALQPETEEAARTEKTEALQTLHTSRLAVLMGGAGTGKTTVVSAFLRGLQESEGRQSKLLLAPTGKARVRLEQVVADELESATEVKAQTIHQFLYRHGWMAEGAFELKAEGDETGGAQTVIIDESSMIPTDLLATLLRALDLDMVRRIVLIGDPNQLPPIGPGRPFFDTIRWLEDEAPSRLADLKQRVRYRAEAGSARDLAEVYAGESPELNDSILSQVAMEEGGADLDVRFWDDTDELFELIGDLLPELIYDIDGVGTDTDLLTAFDISVGYGPEAATPDTWQILSPTNIDTYGTRAINRRIQETFRKPRQEMDDVYSLGDEQFVPGDKVIHTQNRTMESPYSDSKEYVANGEIGVVVDTFSDDNTLHTQYVDKPFPLLYYRGQLRTDPILELAYGLTVHKAQGSDFETVVFILPKHAPTLSRELLYTGLTRYRGKLILLIQQDTGNLYELSKPAASEIRKRNTAMFESSIRADPEVPYPENLIHVTNDGTLVRSKSEVIIANIFNEMELSYEYEEPLSPPSADSTRWPDFTIHHQGEVYYWEHLGMLHVPEYRQDWNEKEAWYNEHGLDNQLVTSRDTPDGAIDSTEIRAIIRDEIHS